MSNSNIYKALLAYRACPLSNNMKSPAELLFRRKIASGLPVKMEATPDFIDHQNKLQEISGKSKQNYDGHTGSELCELLPGMKVLVQDGKTWFPATIKSKNEEPRSYTLITPNGYEIRRNRKFLKDLSVKASQKFTFRSLPDDFKADNPIVPASPRKGTKSVSFNEQKNVTRIIPSEESPLPNSPGRHPAVTPPRERPRRNIIKPIRYREDL